MVPEAGLEPARPKATDFESVVSTNSTTPATRAQQSLVDCGKLYEKNNLGQ